MKRRNFLKLTGLTLTSLALPRVYGANSADSRPNIVLIVSDDLGREVTGCYGNPVVKTPHTDSLAADGTLFTNAFCTSASCSPSRSVILTGLYSHANGTYGLEHGKHHFKSFDYIKSVPVLLNKAGYRTAQIGVYHIGPESVYRFDTYLGDYTGRNSVKMANACRNFIDATKVFVLKDDPRPFFLYFCTNDAHRSKHKVDSRYLPNPFGNRPQGYEGITPVKYDPKDVIVPPFLPDTPVNRAELANYYQAASRNDQGIGQLIKILKETGKYDNTLIISISDHGICFPGGKTTLYEPGMHIPCIMKAPHQKKHGVVNNAMFDSTSLAPTIMDFAGIESRRLPQFHGSSLKSVIEEENPKGFDEAYASHTFHEITMYYPMRVVRGRRYKLIWNLAHQLPFPQAADLWETPSLQQALAKGDKYYGKRTIDAFINRSEFELYDLKTDPDEIKNLADDPKHANTLEKFKEKLKAFQKKTRDPWFIKWQRQ